VRTTKEPSYRFHKASHNAVVTVFGKDIYLGRYKSEESYREYHRVLTEWRAGVRSRDRARERDRDAPADITVSELMLKFVEHAEGYYVKHGRQTSQARTIKHAVRPVWDIYGDELASEFTVQKLEAIQGEYVRQGLARTECNRRVRIVIQAFEWGVVKCRVPATVVTELRMLGSLKKGRCSAPERDPVGPVDDKMIAAVIPFLSRPVAAMVRLQQHTAMRPGEVILMRTCDITPDDEIPGGLWFVPESHKTEHRDRGRKIYLGPRARDVLKDWLRHDEPHRYLFDPHDSIIDLAARRRRGRHDNRHRQRQKTSRRVGHRFSTDSYRFAIATGCDKAHPHPTLSAIPEDELTGEQKAELASWRKKYRFHPHQIRHGVSGRINKHLDIEASRTVLGHAHVNTTELYTERDYRKAAESMERLG
jgi:integrase